MSEEGKVSTDQWYPVILLDDTDFKSPETGKVVGDLTIEYKLLGTGAGWTSYSPAAANWQEMGDGEYALQMGTTEWASAGRYQVHVQCGGCLTYRFSVEANTFTLEDLFTGANIVDFKLNTLNIQSSTGNALTAISGGGGGAGANFAGNGNGAGIRGLGGITGNGIQGEGGASNKEGIIGVGGGSGSGVKGQGGSSGIGMECVGNGGSKDISAAEIDATAKDATVAKDSTVAKDATVAKETAATTNKNTVTSAVSTSESNIRGADSDDLKDLSDQIDEIDNNTDFVSSPPKVVLIPESGDSIFKIACSLYESGVPTDPDSQDGGPQVAIIARAINGKVNKLAFFDDEAGASGATTSPTYTPSLKMVRISAGIFEIYYKLPSTEDPDNWQFTFNYKKTVEFVRQRSITIAETNPDTVNANVTEWDGSAVATPSVAGVPEVDMTHINGDQTNGNNATLKLKKLEIINNAGSAFQATSTGGNGSGIVATGNGSSSGIGALGGVSAIGAITGAGTGSNTSGIVGIGFGNGHGIAGVGAGTGKDLSAAEIVAILLEVNKIANTDAGAGVSGSVIEEIENRAIPGSEMNLADDAITASKYDESTAFPVKKADTGSDEIARTGADGDTLESLSDEHEALSVQNAAININVGVVDGKVDGVKAQTDLMGFVSGAINANIVRINGGADVDGKSFMYVQELMQAMVNGRFKKDTPSAGQITFYKRDNTTVLTVVAVNPGETERTRIS